LAAERRAIAIASRAQYSCPLLVLPVLRQQHYHHHKLLLIIISTSAQG
jgi:hypothetical protein